MNGMKPYLTVTILVLKLYQIINVFYADYFRCTSCPDFVFDIL